MLVNDEWTGASLAAWWNEFLTDRLASLVVSGGTLFLALANGGGPDAFWFNGTVGPQVEQIVIDDFDIEMYAQARNLADTGDVPGGAARIAGLGVYNVIPEFPDGDPVPVSPTGCHLAYGRAPGGAAGDAAMVCEWKSTQDGSTAQTANTGWDTIAWPSGAGWLRIRRVGDDIDFFTRETEDDAWTQVRTTISRPDLPRLMRVGPIIYSQSAGAADVSLRCFTIRNYAEGGANMPIADTEADAILERLRGTAAPALDVEIALFNGDPLGAGTELSGDGYARYDAGTDWSAPAVGTPDGRFVGNASEWLYPVATADWTAATHYAVYDAGGNIRYAAALDASVTITTGGRFRFAPGACQVRIGNTLAA